MTPDSAGGAGGVPSGSDAAASRRHFIAGLTGAGAIGALMPAAAAAQDPPGDMLRARWEKNVKDYGAKGDGVTDDAAAIKAALATIPKATGGTLFMPVGKYLCSTPLDLDDRNGLVLAGESGLASGLGTTLQFTAGGSGSLLSARSASGFCISGMSITYSDPGFTGTLIDLSHGPRARDSVACTFERSVFGGEGNEAAGRPPLSTAGTLLNLDRAICSTFQDCRFFGSQVGIRGRASPDSYSNVIRILGCTFNNQEVAHIKNGGQAWAMIGCTFENLTTATGARAGAGAYRADPGFAASGTTFSGCWCGDATESGNWIEWRGSGLTVTGCYFSTGAGAIRVLGSSNIGMLIAGNQFANGATAIHLGANAINAYVIANDFQPEVDKAVDSTNAPFASLIQPGYADTIHTLYDHLSVTGGQFVSGPLVHRGQAVGLFGAPPVGRAGSIPAPPDAGSAYSQAQVQGIVDAVDALREALKGIGITA